MTKVTVNSSLDLKEPNKPDSVGSEQTLLPADTDVENGKQVCRQRCRPWCCCLSVTVTLLVIALVLFLFFMFAFSRGRCGVDESDDWGELDTEQKFRQALLHQLGKHVQVLEDDNVELIQVPEFNIVHDFNKNLTAFLDLTLNKCYVAPLNTSAVLPPRDLQELISNVTASTYPPQYHLVYEQLVVTGRLDDVEKLGSFISNMCRNYETYRLEHKTGIQKDEALNCSIVHHFENMYVTETQICEL